MSELEAYEDKYHKLPATPAGIKALYQNYKWPQDHSLLPTPANFNDSNIIILVSITDT